MRFNVKAYEELYPRKEKAAPTPEVDPEDVMTADEDEVKKEEEKKPLEVDEDGNPRPDESDSE